MPCTAGSACLCEHVAVQPAVQPSVQPGGSLTVPGPWRCRARVCGRRCRCHRSRRPRRRWPARGTALAARRWGSTRAPPAHPPPLRRKKGAQSGPDRVLEQSGDRSAVSRPHCGPSDWGQTRNPSLCCTHLMLGLAAEKDAEASHESRGAPWGALEGWGERAHGACCRLSGGGTAGVLGPHAAAPTLPRPSFSRCTRFTRNVIVQTVVSASPTGLQRSSGVARFGSHALPQPGQHRDQ